MGFYGIYKIFFHLYPQLNQRNYWTKKKSRHYSTFKI